MKTLKTFLSVLAVWLIASTPLIAQQDFNEQQDALLREMEWPGSMRVCIGMTRGGTRIWCIMDQDGLEYKNPSPRILAVAGLSGEATDWPELVRAARRAVDRRAETGATYRLAIIPLANPDGYFQGLKTGNGVGGDPATGYPPEGTAYNSPTDPERAHVWRFIGWFAPDLVVEAQGELCADWQRVVRLRTTDSAWPKGSLAEALKEHEPIMTGKVPVVRFVTWKDAPPSDELGRMRAGYLGMAALPGNPFARDTDYPASAMREEMLRRLERTPVEVLDQLADHYGRELKFVTYQPALAVICRARLGALKGDQQELDLVGEILKPYLTGNKAALEGKYGGSQLAGLLVFADWVLRTQDPAGIELVKQGADHAFNDRGEPLASMPFHAEMSDAVFMACPLLCRAGQLTGDVKYINMAERHLEFIQKLCLRQDGIYRNSPLCDAAWGRGNGFPALGLALSLVSLEESLKEGKFTGAAAKKVEHVRLRMKRDLVRHMGALSKFQDVTGMWQQVIDEPGSYRELTCTCMIGYALVEGIQRGWLPEEEFGPIVQRAWEGVKVRVGSDGKLIDVCTGTGKQKSLRDYLDRTAILGIDERGGAMAMMFAAAMAEWEQAKSR